MPIIAHIGVGLAAKKIAKDIPVGYLVLAAEAVEIAYIGLLAAGIESMPTDTSAGFAGYSHSLASGAAIAMFGALITYLITKSKRKTLIISMLIFSHTLLDLIASPQFGFYAQGAWITLFPFSDIRLGLGLYNNTVVALALEVIALLGGILIYLRTKREMKLRNIS